MRIALFYSDREASRPAAALTLGDRQDRACRLPGRVDARARFFLERVETEDPALEAKLIDILTRDSITVNRATAGTRGPVRTRGDYRAEEPYGTPAYWRAAIGRLPDDMGLDYDLDDYRALLEWFDRRTENVAPAVAQPQPEHARELIRKPSPSVRETALALLSWLQGPQLALRTRGVRPLPEHLVGPLLEELRTDREFLQATANLRLALTLPDEERSKILSALESLARRAQSHESRPD
jgi:hypothetical protein